MAKLSAYTIAFKGLKPGKHEFEYTIDSAFFELFEESFVKEGKVGATVLLVKEASVFTLHFRFRGFVLLLCDRCLEMYEQPVNYETQAFIKFDDEKQEEEDDIIWLSHDEHQINVARLLYEYIILSLPLKHVHPDSANGVSLCNPEMLKKLEELKPDSGSTHEDDRWSDLRKLMNNN